MPLAPVEFTVQAHKFRHTPLAAIPLAREVHKLMSRFDSETGALDTLAFTLGQEDYDAIAEGDAQGIVKLVKLLSILVGTSVAATPAVDEGEPPAMPSEPADKLPNTLDGLLLYYVDLGNIENAVGSGDAERWVAHNTEEQLNAHPLTISPFVCAFHVLRGIFGPFVETLQGFSAEAQKKKKAAAELLESTATSENTDS